MAELRKDLVSGDWIILAPERAGRPGGMRARRGRRIPAPKAHCPFEEKNLQTAGMWPPILRAPEEGKWRAVLVSNRYPALTHNAGCAAGLFRGPHEIKTGSGEHDLIITRDHNKNFAHIAAREAAEVLGIARARYLMMAKDSCGVYTSVFFNWGQGAGASVYHPHFQVLTLPIVPPRVAHSLAGSRAYFLAHKKCAHCAMLAYDRKDRRRVVVENKHAIAIAPFISKHPFEVRVFPKRHFSQFAATPQGVLGGVAGALQAVMRRMERRLNDPDMNFFIHTAPLRGNAYGYYHWHIEVVPKLSTLGGFELSTGVDINVVDPAQAASFLKRNARK